MAASDVDMAMSPDVIADMAADDMPAAVSGDMAHHVPVFSFGAATQLMQTDPSAKEIYLGDFNADGKRDLLLHDTSIVALSYAGVIDPLVGNGDGSFTYNAANDVTAGADYSAVFDVNNDGKTDVVMFYETYNSVTRTTTPHLQYATSNGDGTFTVGNFAWTTSSFTNLYAGDLNGDHAVELFAYSYDTSNAVNGFAVFMNNGSNTLTRANYVSPTYPIPVSDLIIQDVTGDGKVDVVYAAKNQAVVVAGDGTGMLAAAPTILNTGSANNLSLVLADVNADTHPDLIVGQDTNSVTVLLASANGGFVAANTYPSQGNATAIAAGDFDGDGLADILTCDMNNLTFLINLGNGFKAPIQITQPCGRLAVADFNGDHLADVATAAGTSGAFVLLNTTH